jgi:uncharacterized RDD family membrane protein YckC
LPAAAPAYDRSLPDRIGQIIMKGSDRGVAKGLRAGHRTMYEFDLIETPENVELERRLAGIGSRLIAGLVDSLLILLILLGISLLVLVLTWGSVNLFGGTFGWLGEEAAPVALAAWILLVFVLLWGYFVFFELRTNGQSPGKKHVKIRVVKAQGGPVTFVDVAVRNLLRAVDFLPFLYGLGGLVMFVTKRAQRLGDLAAGTVVVSEARPDYAAKKTRRAEQMQWERPATAEALRATGLTPQEYQVLSNYWARRGQLTLEARRRVLPQLLRPILQRLGEQLPDESLARMEYWTEVRLHNAAQAEALAEIEKDRQDPGQQGGPRT